MEISDFFINPSSLVNILTLRYDPSISPNLPKKNWNDFETIDNTLSPKIIEKLICDSIEKKTRKF